jgi:hypothetical protein
MLKKPISVALAIVAVILMVMAGCTKTTTVIIDNSPDITTEVSFSKELSPLLTQNCALSGCHDGSVRPNLKTESALSSLITGNYLNKQDPENSEVYLYMTAKKTPAMPLGAPNNPDNINKIMLAWIKQGAKNN